VTISFTDDLLTPIHLDKDLKEVDLIGITVLTKTALRAYEIAEAYRKKRIPVVLGGIHPTALPEEAKKYADSIVMGEAEGVYSSLKMPRRAISSLSTAKRVTRHCQTFQFLGETFSPQEDISLWMWSRSREDVLSVVNSVPSRSFLEKLIGSGRSRRWLKRCDV
jgi:hypothetical protein